MKSLIDRQGVLSRGLANIRAQFQVPPQFDPAVLTEADLAAARPVSDHSDWTALDFVTLDPKSSTDLDQAFAIEKGATDLLLHYAIADVAWFVVSGRGEEEELPSDALRERTAAKPASKVAAFRDLELTGLCSSNSRETPRAIRQTAVLAFMVTSPGMRVLSAGI